ncbi:MAG: 2-oxo acid dehydrogenase subunit E2 [Rhodobacterales bacterium]|nr:2-oxo acid dehydrogenase subunit E2 [Rhodobacterales bacterium]MDX5500069.1 2-oxo acid dehydrogenase subunit E2 [Rhodobacterales bacterium]
MSVFAMPSLGPDMDTGKLIEWLVKPGDHVSRGDIVAVVETQKGAIEIEIFETGEVAELLAQPGQTLPVGTPMARLAGAGCGAIPAAAPDVPEHPSVTPPPPAPALASGPAPASPAARARAAELGLALDGITGSGPGGAVLLADVERQAAPTARPGLDMAEMRRAIAAAMTRSKRDIPHYYLAHEIDLQAAQDWLAATNAGRTPDRRLLMGALLVRAVVRALAKVPELNGQFQTAPYAPLPEIHCGLAIALRAGGLIAPAILNAQAMDTDAIMAAMRDLVARTRAGRLRNSELTRGTITISSLGERGVDALTGVIYPPQVALVGFGTPRLKPMVHDGTVQPRLAVTATLAADHRISDGRRGALFLAETDRLLQEPETL